MIKDKRTYDVLMPVWDKPEPFFAIGPRFRGSLPGRYNPWRLGPDDTKQSTHVLAGTRQSLITIFPEAIAIGSSSAVGKGHGGRMAIAVFVPLMIFLMYMIVASTLQSGFGFFQFFFLFQTFFVAYITWWFVRNWLATPADWPIVFNRKTRQVSYLPVTPTPFWRFWLMPKSEFCTRSWDDLRVRSYKYMEGTAGGRSFHDSYSLLLLWGGEGGDPRALHECVGIGYQGYFEDELIWMLWEHIRRYMEEDGPAIPHGEVLRPKTRGKPVIYPPDLIAAAGGPALSVEAVDKLAEEAIPE